MNTSKTKKIFTLLVFAICIAGFVCYKAGIIDKHLVKNADKPQHPIFSANSISVADIDSPPVAIDTVRYSRDMLPTSKSMIIVDQKIKLPPVDSSGKPEKK